MKQYLYNDPVERCKRVNRVFLLAACILFSVLIVYQSMLVSDGLFPESTAPFTLGALILFFLLDTVLFLKNRATGLLKYCITIEVGIAFWYYMMTTSANFLGLALIGVLGVSILYYDSRSYTITFILYVLLYIGGQIVRVTTHVVEGDSNGLCNVIMTFAVFVMLFIISRLSKMFSDHALGTVEEQSRQQAQMMQEILNISHVVKEESDIGTDMANRLYGASEQTTESMHIISGSTEKIAENIVEQTTMTQDIQDAIYNAKEYSEEMVSIATGSNEEIQQNLMMMQNLQEQSRQISQTNVQVTAAMERLQQRTEEVAAIVSIILNISNQTNLLALNASIESARAGEAGRGFAVVAEQIRQLAEETRRSTESITGIIAQLNANAKEVVDVIHSSVAAAASQNDMIEVAADAFEGLSLNMKKLIKTIEEINMKIENLSDANQQIMDSITQLSALSEEVSSSAEQTNQLTEKNMEYVEQTRESIQTIQSSTSRLEAYI
ncbi:MAG: chemotaxis protein [Lachnospiraceae bacterium]|nr:chemotaxis protein [Lachnospiraceae bacterium]